MRVLVEGQDVVVGVPALILGLAVEGVLRLMCIEEHIGVPADLLGGGHRVRILLLRHRPQHLQFLLELVVLLTLLLLLILVHFLSGFVRDDAQVLGVEVEVLIEHAAPHFFLDGLLPLRIQLHLVHVLSRSRRLVRRCHI